MHQGAKLAPRFWERLVRRFGPVYLARQSEDSLWILCCRFCSENHLPLGRASWDWKDRWLFLEKAVLSYKTIDSANVQFICNGNHGLDPVGLKKLLETEDD